MSAKTAWVAGASGLVGGHALDALLDDARWGAVVSFGRRTIDREHPKLTQRAVDFAAIEASGAPRPDAARCCLGTTIKKAGSEAAFRAVDHDAVVAFARAAKAAGCEVFAVVTAHGADAGSMIFYNRVKGGRTRPARHGLRVAEDPTVAVARRPRRSRPPSARRSRSRVARGAAAQASRRGSVEARAGRVAREASPTFRRAPASTPTTRSSGSGRDARGRATG
ncbi:MAG: hypothetical protein R3A52_30515 [Polyangiales bacterium]